MSRVLELALASVLTLCGLPAAHAIGDSGGCGDPLGQELRTALNAGDAHVLDATLRGLLDAMEKSVTASKPRSIPPAGTDARRMWRDRQALDLIGGNQDKGVVCGHGPLLPIAMNAGNVEGTRYLLSRPLGVEPRIPADVLFTCNNESPTGEQRTLRRQAFALVIDSGRVDINARAGARHRTALETCNDAALLSLFVERGATLDTESASRFDLLDEAIAAALGFDETSYTARRLGALDRARFFSERVSRSIRGRQVEARARDACHQVIQGKRWNPETCRALSAFIVAAPGTFGDP